MLVLRLIRVLGLWVCGFKVFSLGFRVLGLWVCGFRVFSLGFRVLGFRGLGFRMSKGSFYSTRVSGL